MTTIPILILFVALLCLIMLKMLQWIIIASAILLLRYFWLDKREKRRIIFEKNHITHSPTEGFLEVSIKIGVQCPHNLGYWDYYATKRKRLKLPHCIAVTPSRIVQGENRAYLIYIRKERLGDFFRLFKPHQTGTFHFMHNDVYLHKRKHPHADRLGICCDEAFGYLTIEVRDGKKVIHVY